MKPKKVRLGLEDFIFGIRKKRQIRGNNQTVYRTPLNARYLKESSDTSIRQYIKDTFKNCICPEIGEPPQPDTCTASSLTLYCSSDSNDFPLTIAISSNRKPLSVQNSQYSRYSLRWGFDAVPENKLNKGATIDVTNDNTPFNVNFEADDSITVV